MLGLMPLYEGEGMCDYGVSYVLIFPEGSSPTLHIADTPDPIDDGHIVPVAGA